MLVLEVQSMTVTNLALLHAGGWDEVLMVAVGLVAAWAIITWTGRSRDYDEDEEDEVDDREVAGGDEDDHRSEDRPLGRLKGDRDDE